MFDCVTFVCLCIFGSCPKDDNVLKYKGEFLPFCADPYCPLPSSYSTDFISDCDPDFLTPQDLMLFAFEELRLLIHWARRVWTIIFIEYYSILLIKKNASFTHGQWGRAFWPFTVHLCCAFGDCSVARGAVRSCVREGPEWSRRSFVS